MRRLTMALGGTLLAAAVTVTAAPLAAAQDTGTVFVVHGIPDLTVDVFIDGELALDDFEPGTVEGPVELPAGSLDVAVTAADAENADDALLEATVDLTAGDNVSLVAYLSEDAEPVLSAFANDVSDVAPGEARLVVRHTAAAPAVDVLAGDDVVVSDLSNPDAETLNLEAAELSVAVAAAGDTDPLIGPVDLDLQEGTATFVHAIGSADDGSLDVVAFSIDGLWTPPVGVPSGAPSGAPAEPGFPIALGISLLAGAGLVLGGTARYRAARAGR